MKRAVKIAHNTWTSWAGVISVSLAAIMVYVIFLFINGEYKNPAWIVFWAITSSSVAAILGAISERHLASLEETLEHNISNPSGFVYVVSTTDGAKIGELDEATYLKAKHTVDICLSRKILQLLNYLWVAFSMFSRSLSVIPFLLVLGMFVYQYAGVDGSMSELTVGEILESDILISLFPLIFLMIVITSFVRGYKNLPGHKNYYERQLRQLLSKDLPNIANANGFYITSYKIAFESNTAEVSL